MRRRRGARRHLWATGGALALAAAALAARWAVSLAPQAAATDRPAASLAVDPDVAPLAVALGATPRAALPPSRPPPQRGISLGLFAEDPDWSYAGLLREIAEAGATHVELVVPWYQHDIRSLVIAPHPRFSPPDGTVVRTIRDAHRLGLRVLLFPILRLEYAATPLEWRGSIEPPDRDAWFRSYQRFILHLARLAGRERVALLSVGSELSSVDGQDDLPRWQRLASHVRRAFAGPLVYSANWDRYERVGIFSIVDLLGVCAYFGLTEGAVGASVELLAERWQPLRAQLVAVRARHGKPLLLTEVGYLSQRGSNAWPWDEAAQKELDLEEQRRCYAAFIRTWDGVVGLEGVYFWTWFGFGGPRSKGYTPRGKPAADELARWFGGRAIYHPVP